ncbi:MAG: hypothetical protein Q7S61_03855 [bacterium]|nr:hypothetical protein [bacterium]
MNNYHVQFLKIGHIAGMHYTVPGRKTKRIVVYGIGAPLPPDSGKLNDASVIMGYDTDLYVPDYIGYGRSEGMFTPLNCVKTFLHLYNAFIVGCTGVCNYASLKKKLHYDEVHFIGRSFGGAYVTLLPRFNKEITNICGIYPMLNWANIGKSKGQIEETVEGFFKAMKEDGYQFLYRGILNSSWKKHFTGEDDLNPVDNLKYLKNAKIFIGHGKKDVSIYYGNSVNYHNKLIKMFPYKKDRHILKLYPFDHGNKTSNKVVSDYLQYMGVKNFNR